MAYPTAIGCGCLLGVGGAPRLLAAEWSMQPAFSWSADYDSDRSLAPAGVQGSEEGVLSADVQLQRSVENLKMTLEPHFDVRRYSDSVWGPTDDRSLATSLAWSGERTQLNVSGSISNQTTLTTELLETGIVNADTRRRTAQASGELDFSKTEKHLFFAQVSYSGTTYSGPPLVQLELPGYRYGAASAGERFLLSEHLTLSASAFGDILRSDRQGGSSYEAGGQVELNYAHSEYTTFDVSVGQSRRTLAGVPGNGTNVSASVTRKLALGSVALSYTRSLVPYGTGFLVERQQVTASATRALTPYLTADVAVLRVQNNQSTVRLGLDRPYYDNAVAGLNWQLSETWSLRSQVSTSWSQPIHSAALVHEWRAGLTMTWTPGPSAISR
jgi:hypothetical protein